MPAANPMLVTLLALNSAASSAALAPKPPTRRGVLAAAGSVAAGVKAASAASEPQSNSKPWVADARIGADEQYAGSLPYDPWAHSSLFGLVPPPVAGTWSHQELVDAARGGGVASVQIAPQHDVVIAVSTSGRRYATPMLDDDFPTLLLETTRPDGSYPFAVLPMDESLTQREKAQRERAEGARPPRKRASRCRTSCAARLGWRASWGLAPRRTSCISAASQRDATAERLEPAAAAEVRAQAVELRERAAKLRFRAKLAARRLQREYEPAWVTPLTAGGELPRLEQLLRPFRVWTDGARERASGRSTSSSLRSRALQHAAAGTVRRRFRDEMGVWRLSAPFSRFYGQPVYILRRCIA
ncbi:hypothetical protein EMIHUDRAFT_315437 [Emiliania huxleyi CCMP1516]|uniref:Uncharacterized protein n=2 Tax=Emiliania huxleyi TaxID=2903 RepID=A0A0D3JLS8_EMIH1|nr:hypothetical protein EMIHUDRAFT_315437 [Emiliania huxleyi CCMP1516]EOD24463.1 hypothetical protein EMIHUDRAFT_315437 [Emiliania huxleyi CCMP1516]|eukprot:XP_005776892.1 hypothetical protein EMIHUDRAFT_315437 [Emiliania huxleyi CCMP1516]